MRSRNLVGWALYSPRRLLVVTGLVLALVLGAGGLSLAARPDHPEAAAAAPAPAAQKPTPSSTAGTIAPPDEAHDAWPEARRTTQQFLAKYVVPTGQDPRVVSPDLARLTTPTLWRGLRLADPTQLPHGRVVGLRPLGTGAYAAEAVAQLSGGHTLTLTLEIVAWSHGWRVADVRPAEGS